jgi:hypothetical protein
VTEPVEPWPGPPKNPAPATGRRWAAPHLAARLTARPITAEQLAAALARTHAWFEVNSGWAPPDPETLEDWAAEGACRAPDDCWTPLHGLCRHGLTSWRLVLDELDELDAATLHSSD